MKIPNWQHHSKKERKRHLKPQALRSAKKRRGQLLNRLLSPAKRRGFLLLYRYREKKFPPMKNFAKVAGITLLILITLLRFGSTENGRMKRL